MVGGVRWVEQVLRMLWVGCELLWISQMMGKVDGIWRFRECVMHSATACATSTTMYCNALQGITMVYKRSSGP